MGILKGMSTVKKERPENVGQLNSPKEGGKEYFIIWDIENKKYFITSIKPEDKNTYFSKFKIKTSLAIDENLINCILELLTFDKDRSFQPYYKWITNPETIQLCKNFISSYDFSDKKKLESIKIAFNNGDFMATELLMKNLTKTKKIIDPLNIKPIHDLRKRRNALPTEQCAEISLQTKSKSINSLNSSKSLQSKKETFKPHKKEIFQDFR